MVTCFSLALSIVLNSFQTALAVMTGGVATSSLYTILHLIRQMKYNVMWLRVLLMVSMEDSLLVTVEPSLVQWLVTLPTTLEAQVQVLSAEMVFQKDFL